MQLTDSQFTNNTALMGIDLATFQIFQRNRATERLAQWIPVNF
jgi:hypothetical protein